MPRLVRDIEAPLRAEIDRLAGCLIAICSAKESTPASVLRGIAYDAALNCITPDVAEFQIERRTALQKSE